MSNKTDRIKITIIGAGSVCFCPTTVADILLSEKLAQVEIDLVLMDISADALAVSASFARNAVERLNRNVKVSETTDLRASVDGADYVITAIEKKRYHYWSQDFHVPRRYGFRQVYGENGGPGGMFHFLRNVGPMLEVAHAMEAGCPEAWLLNYTNPEAKLIEAITKLSKVNVVGLCHGEQMGIDQLAKFLEIPREQISVEATGLNHFGWFTRIRHRETGEDLYPLLRDKERKADWLAGWDEFALTRIMFRTYGLWSYPGTNHIGEYIAWSDAYLASALIQYFHDPVHDKPWTGGETPEFVYSFGRNPTARKLFPPDANPTAGDPAYTARFDPEKQLTRSREFGVNIIEAMLFNEPVRIGAVNVANKGYAPGLLPDMAVEVPAMVDGQGLHPCTTEALPTAIRAMINQQGAIHDLLIQAYHEKSRMKLLQALLLDPTVSSYNNAVALIDEMWRIQSDILPELTW